MAKVKVHELRDKKKADIVKQLDELKTELSSVRTRLLGRHAVWSC